MAFVQNRGNGSWLCTISGGYGPDGKQIRITRTFHADANNTVNSQKRQALKYANELETDYTRQQITCAGKVTIESAYQDYIADMERKGLAKRTVDDYKKLFNREIIPQLGKLAVRDLDAKSLNRFFRGLSKKGLGGTYQLKYFQQLDSLCKYCMRSGIITVNPCRLIIPPKRDTEEAGFYEPEECVMILDVLKNLDNKEWAAYFILSIFCGTRPGELQGLDWEDVDFEREEIFIQAGIYKAKGQKPVRTNKPKTRKSIRKIKLSKDAIEALNSWKKEQEEYRLPFGDCWPEESADAVFTSEEGYRLSPDRPSRIWKKITKRNGIRYLPPYDFRHTHATLLVASNELSIEEVSARMGHEQTSTTLNIYAHAIRGANEKATSALVNVLDKARKKAE